MDDLYIVADEMFRGLGPVFFRSVASDYQP